MTKLNTANRNICDITYNNWGNKSLVKRKQSIKPYGIDTEAYNDGKCFMIATSEHDVFTFSQFPQCFFNRKYKNKSFVAYNLKYDEGAFLQFLPMSNLQELREKGKTIYNEYIVKSIPRKYLFIRKGKDGITFYDMYNFYLGSLNYNAKKYLGKEKVDIETKSFSPSYVSENWEKIASYCIQDAILVKELSELLIKKFEHFGVYPNKLFSTAFISFQYFRQHCKIIDVGRFWKDDKKLLQFSLNSYNGGKFEVTERGTGYFYLYDIVSAYPYEISNLVDITGARILWNKKYLKGATYSFIKCKIIITANINSPIAVNITGVNIYPCGYIEKVITKKEYEYLIENNCDIEILEAVHLICPFRKYPYREVIYNLMKYKNEYKEKGLEMEYHTIKIFLNSFYGKFIQMIYSNDKYKCGLSWNPIYASIITANIRLKVSQIQNTYNNVIAVHTDSVISKTSLPIPIENKLGSWTLEKEGYGVLLGSGIYQIGSKCKIRGYQVDIDLFELCDTKKKEIMFHQNRVLTWKEVVFHNWDKSKINYFDTVDRVINVNFDQKRLWYEQYKNFQEVLKHNITSSPHFVDFSSVF